MIEINLLPGSGKKARSKGAGVNFSELAAGFTSRVKDPWLLGAVGSAILATAAVGAMYWYQGSRGSSLEEQLRVARQDSVRYAAVINEKRKAEAQRDSVLRQVSLIKSFDDKRYVWPHLMDEVSRALPPYTWLTSISQTNVVDQAAQASPPPAAKGKAAAAAEPDSVVTPPVKLRIVGHTVDIQALTRFMRVLESSPFIENVQLVKSTMIVVDGKQVTEFQLDAAYQPPDSSAITVVPVSLSVR
ncbi:MAG TPA: PilN domain-containing protein [Gemmatimonadaceae bacterium]|jgi:Tfp pilus assembly protein PilN|nr:PilN domain-containing protein [Gemmatimonadaceae bacterium]